MTSNYNENLGDIFLLCVMNLHENALYLNGCTPFKNPNIAVLPEDITKKYKAHLLELLFQWRN